MHGKVQERPTDFHLETQQMIAQKKVEFQKVQSSTLKM